MTWLADPLPREEHLRDEDEDEKRAGDSGHGGGEEHGEVRPGPAPRQQVPDASEPREERHEAARVERRHARGAGHPRGGMAEQVPEPRPVPERPVERAREDASTASANPTTKQTR